MMLGLIRDKWANSPPVPLKITLITNNDLDMEVTNFHAHENDIREDSYGGIFEHIFTLHDRNLVKFKVVEIRWVHDRSIR